MYSNYFVPIAGHSSCKFLQVRLYNYLLKYSTSALQPNKKTGNKVQVEILEDNANYNHLMEIMKEKENATIKQANLVRDLKAENAENSIIEKEVTKLKLCKQVLEELKNETNHFETFDKGAFSEYVKQKFFYSPSNNMYKPIAGFYDYDPSGCRILDNIYREWEKHFLNKEKMLTIKCPCITSESVLKASRHVSKFTNFMIKDSGSAENFRLDHTIKKFFENILSDTKHSENVKNEARMRIPTLEGMTLEGLMDIVKKFEIKSPVSGMDLVNPVELNLMFPVSIGPSGAKGFLRPESSQGIFIKFKKLLAANNNNFPFACAQVGSTFRNEICPSGELLRLREFNIAEIEQFYYPETKCDKLHKVANTKLWLYSACNQLENYKPQLMEIRTAVEEGLISNEYLAYYMARTELFLEKIGLSQNKIRFRQHINKELAHYSSACWDVECSTSVGWVECVSLADRGQFDLKQHASATGDSITVAKRLKRPRHALSLILNMKEIKKKYDEDHKQIVKMVEELSDDEIKTLKEAIDQNREYTLDKFTICKEMVHSFELKETLFENVVPAVVEPSFGMDRIFYSLLEHTYRMRGQESRSFCSLPPNIAPYKCSVLPLFYKPECLEVADRIENELTELNIISAPLQSASVKVGKRYVKLDLSCVPFVITVDNETLKDTLQTVTIRERDSTEQIRIPIEDIPDVMRRLCDGSMAWNNATKIYNKI